jgi:hypothetical protein
VDFKRFNMKDDPRIHAAAQKKRYETVSSAEISSVHRAIYG